ncbi:hypothetical protein [Acinetobacter bereziniae]|uniref:hypothetical protein n=1 Tax=Acinetobacter bereziniae TaxID=106648 RepID=UPI003AF699E2
MKLNKTLYYTHNTLFGIYGIFLILFIFFALTSGFRSTGFLDVLFVFSILCGLAYIHYKAAIEVEKGSEIGKLMSTLIGCLLLIGFPVGTCIGLLILLNVRKAKWQSGN